MVMAAPAGMRLAHMAQGSTNTGAKHLFPKIRMLITGAISVHSFSIYRTGRAQARRRVDRSGRMCWSVARGSQVVSCCAIFSSAGNSPQPDCRHGAAAETSSSVVWQTRLSLRASSSRPRHARGQVPALQARVCAVADARHARHRGNLSCGGKFGPPEQAGRALYAYRLCARGGRRLRGLPLQAHLPHEPVLPQEAGQVIAVLGLTRLVRPIASAPAGALCRAGRLHAGGHCHAGARRARARGRGAPHAGAAQSGRCR